MLLETTLPLALSSNLGSFPELEPQNTVTVFSDMINVKSNFARRLRVLVSSSQVPL